MVGYLRARGLATRVRVLMAGATASYLVLPVSMLASSAGPHGPWPRAAVILAVGGALLGAASFAWRWPARRWSVIRTVITAAAITVVCSSYTDPVIGLVGATTFAMLGGYIAFFHSLRLQTLNLGLGLLTATLLAVRALSNTRSDVIATLNLYAVVAVAILALPATAHVLAHFLGGDLDTSDTDPLTGLLNRRAFYRATHHLLATADGSPSGHLSVLMIDLDDFKGLNDTHGHRAGDTALVAVGRLLTRHTPDRAVVARVGGEEFLIADLADPPSAQRCATQLCAAITSIEFDTTASIGIATAELCAHPFDDDRALIDHLIDLADTTMYDAKRAGGNQARSTP
jgi:diguanylate cyclase (GGDEF)-like protein